MSFSYKVTLEERVINLVRESSKTLAEVGSALSSYDCYSNIREAVFALQDKGVLSVKKYAPFKHMISLIKDEMNFQKSDLIQKALEEYGIQDMEVLPKPPKGQLYFLATEGEADELTYRYYRQQIRNKSYLSPQDILSCYEHANED